MATPDRFELEQSVMECWRTADDLQLIAVSATAADHDVDKLANVLLGLAELHTLRVQRLWDIFEQLVEQGNLA
jgi:hypothetical protein